MNNTATTGRQITNSFRHIGQGSVLRRDTFDGELSELHCDGYGDMSPFHSSLGGGYDSRCGWCYLGAGHTDDAHRRQCQ